MKRTTLMLAVGLSTAACETIPSEVSMRDFASSARRSAAAESDDFVLSSIECADGTEDCGCSLEDAYLAQVFLKDPGMLHTNALAARLMRDGIVNPAEPIALKSNMQIGIDLHYRADASGFKDILEGRDEYTVDGEMYRDVQMQDTPLFTNDFPFDRGATTLEGTASYTFAVGASALNPNRSPVDCFITVVVDFDAIE